jgi:uncharacterized membrane protein YdjX (TVP38/TMEM64 family)
MHRHNRYIKIGIVVILAFILTYLTVTLDIFHRGSVQKLLAEERNSAHFKLYFIAVATVLLMFFIPLSWVSLSAAIFFGIEGAIIITICSLLSGIISFGIARIFKEDVSRVVEKIYNRKKRKLTLDEIYSKVKRHGFGYVLFIRSMPIIPFNICNLIFGISFVPFMEFVFATFLSVFFGQGINIYFIHKALNIGKAPRDTVVAAVLKGVYFLIILLWQKKSKYIVKDRKI